MDHGMWCYFSFSDFYIRSAMLRPNICRSLEATVVVENKLCTPLVATARNIRIGIPQVFTKVILLPLIRKSS